jgi:single-strand DNA-binding protein
MSKAILALSGTVGKDADIRQTNSGLVARFPVAANSRQKDRDGNWNDLASWFEVTVFGKNEQYLRDQFYKGAKVFVSGELAIEQWTDRDGNKRMTPRVTANHAEGLSRQGDAQTTAPRAQQRPEPQARHAPEPQAGDPYDADIPFAPVANTW